MRLSKSEFLELINGIISDNLDNDHFDTEELAVRVGLSRSSLHRRMKAACGMPAGVYIRTSKLGKAKELLEGSSSNITEIAFECGFRSLNSFDVCFKEQFGFSPGTFRSNIVAKRNQEIREAFIFPEKSTKNLVCKPFNELHNFPVPLTTFIGRKNEIKSISEMLTGHRVISIVGAGGCGKTRLACEVVKQMEQKFEDGAWFVDLAALENGEYVAKEVMKSLNILEVVEEAFQDTLVRKLKDSNCLILLDNCEHLADEVARIADKLTQAQEGLKIISTSRVVLNIKGEKIWRIPSLSLVKPDKVKTAEQARLSEAVQLFLDRAKLGDDRFELTDKNSKEIVSICDQLDGIPLALELVASRIRYMEPELILERLSNNFSELSSLDPGAIKRQKTLNDAMEWSYKLLTDEERLLFKRLTVFSGGFDVEAVEEVCSDKFIPAEYVLDLISSLVDRSILNTSRQQGKSFRYNLLETLRQFGAKHMEEKETAWTRRKHLDYYIRLADKAYSERQKSQAFWMNKINIERENLTTALNWAEKNAKKKFSLLASSLLWFWSRSDNIKQARQVVDLVLSNGYARGEMKAKILQSYATIMSRFSDHRIDLISVMKQSISIWHKLNNKKEETYSLADLSLIYFWVREDDKGLEYAKKAYMLSREVNEPDIILIAMAALSQGYVNNKMFSEARSMAKKVFSEAIKLNNLTAQFVGHHNQADCALMEEQYNEAERKYGKGLEMTMKAGDLNYTLVELTGIAMSVAGQGRYEKAFRLMGAVNNCAEKSGLASPEIHPMIFWNEQIIKHITGTREKLGEALDMKYEAEGAAMELEEATAYALDFEAD